MKFRKRDTIIILIAGKARSGKSMISNYFREVFLKGGKKVIVSPFTKYLKKYIEDITGIEVTEENKPRDLLQSLSSDLIKKLGYQELFINRQIEDLTIYSYFVDVVLIPDVRFPSEIEVIKEKFDNVISIGVVRDNYVSDLTKKQQNDITEVALDDYDNYDYVIYNDGHMDLKKEVLKIIRDF